MILRGPRVHCYFPAGTPSLRPPRAHRTVLRLGEALALRWPDVDLERGALRIRGTLRIDGRLLVTEPETAKPKRFVPISVQTERLLRDLRDARPRTACAPARPGSRAATCSPPSSANPATRATPCGPSRQRPPGPGSRGGPAPAPALGGQRDAHAASRSRWSPRSSATHRSESQATSAGTSHPTFRATPSPPSPPSSAGKRDQMVVTMAVRPLRNGP
jgi:integrase